MTYKTGQATQGIDLERLSWIEAESLLNAEAIVVIPLGAAAKEHGPHLPLNTDWLQAEYLKQRLMAQVEAVFAPIVNYHFFPAFVEYPGSTSLSFETARDLVLDICLSLGHHGPRRFYVLNYGVSTNSPLQATAALMAEQGYLLHFTDLTKARPEADRISSQQPCGTHADMNETSIMLFIAPELVDMRKAVKDCNASLGPGGLSRNPDAKAGVYSASGVWGDATLATAEQGRQLVEELLTTIVADIALLKVAPLPEAPL